MAKYKLKDAVRDIDPLKFPITVALKEDDRKRYYALRKQMKAKKKHISVLVRKAILKVMDDIEGQL